MQNHIKSDRDSTLLPEVVPANNFGADADRSSEWSSNQHSGPPSHSDYVSPQYGVATPKYLLQSQQSDHGVLPTHRFKKTSRKRFAFLVALGVFLLTAFALSTGLGIPLAKCRNRFSPNSYAPLSPNNINTVKFNGFCDNKGNPSRPSIYNASGNAQFDLICGSDLRSGLPALDTSSGAASGTVRDMVVIVAYSVGSCIEACASMNKLATEASSRNPKCQSVTFTSQMKNSLNESNGNCFLKNATLANLNEAYKDDSTYVSAEVHSLRSQILD